MSFVEDLYRLYELGAIEELLSKFEAFDENEQSSSYYLLRAYVSYKIGWYPEALRYAKLAYKLSPGSDASYLVAQLAVQFGLGRPCDYRIRSTYFDERVVHWELQQLVEEESAEEIRSAIDGLRQRSGESVSVQVATCISEWFRTSDEALLTEAKELSLRNKDVNNLYLLSRLEYQRSEWSAAEFLSLKSVELDPFECRSWMMLLTALLAQRRFESALTSIEVMPAHIAQSYAVRKMKARIRVEMGDLIAGSREFLQLSAECPFDRLVAKELYTVQKKLHRYVAACVQQLSFSMAALKFVIAIRYVFPELEPLQSAA